LDPDQDTVTLDGKTVIRQNTLLVAMYKPKLVLTTMNDPQGRPCIKDLIPKQLKGVFPVGSFVKLSGGEHAVVMQANAERPTKPVVKVAFDAKIRPRIPCTLDLDALSGTPQAQDIAQVLNPAELQIDLEPFFLS